MGASETADREELLKRSRVAASRIPPVTDDETGAVIRQLTVQDVRVMAQRFPEGNGIDSLTVTVRGRGHVFQEHYHDAHDLNGGSSIHWPKWPARGEHPSGSADLLAYALSVLRQHQILDDLADL